MRTSSLVWLSPLVLAAACTGSSHNVARLQPPAATTHAPAATTQPPAASTRPVTASTPMCTTAGLSLRLGTAGGAAGSTYQPIVFTNKGSSSCTLTGYPGVSYVAPQTGKQVGAAASRNPQHAVSTVTLAPGGHASALLQLVNDANYPPADCHAVSVSGLRVYPPGNTAAAYVAFSHATTACSTQVDQLSVASVVTGTTGQTG